MKKIFFLILLLILISGYLFSQQKPRIVVLNFKPINVAEFFSETVTENLYALLPKHVDLEVVSKSEISRVLREMNITDTFKIEDDIGIEICKKLNAKLLLTGSLSQVGFKTFLNTRIIDIEKELIVYSNSFDTTSKNQIWEYIQVLVQDISESRLDIIEYIVKKGKIAVLNFNLLSPDINKEVPINFKNFFNTFLQKYKYYTVVDSKVIDQSIKDLGLEKVNIFNENEAKKIGEKLNVELVLFGDISIKDNKFYFNAKVIDVQKGEVVFGRTFKTGLLSHIREISDRISVLLSSDAKMDIKAEIIDVELEEYSYYLKKDRKLFIGFLSAGLPLAIISLGSGIAGGALFGVYSYRNQNLPNIEDDGTYYNQSSNIFLAAMILTVAVCPALIIPGTILSFMSIPYYIKYKHYKNKLEEISYYPIIEFNEDKISLGFSFKF